MQITRAVLVIEKKIFYCLIHLQHNLGHSWFNSIKHINAFNQITLAILCDRNIKLSVVSKRLICQDYITSIKIILVKCSGVRSELPFPKLLLHLVNYKQVFTFSIHYHRYHVEYAAVLIL